MEDLFRILQTDSTLTVPQIASRLGLSFVLAVIVAFVYRLVTTRRDSHDNMLPSLIIMCITIAAAIMLIGDNLARSFGLVGAVSIIRFRAAVKSPIDMAFIFLIIVVGMACGVGLFTIALIFSAFVLLVILVIWKLKAINNLPSFVVEFTYAVGSVTQDEIERDLTRHGYRYRFLSLRTRKTRRTVAYAVRLPLDRVSSFVDLFGDMVNRRVLRLRIRPS